MSVKEFIYHHLNKLLPSACILCGERSTTHFCHHCQQDLPILSHHCPKCAEILPFSADACGRCLTNPPPFDLTYALFPYEKPIINLIIALKFQHKLQYANVLAHCLITKIQQAWYKNQPLPDIIIPVPLHPLRLRERGFNQALEIAKPLGKALKLPIDINGLTRIKHTSAQSHLSAKARLLNVKNAFIASSDYTGLTIALFDDVVTTGHTVNACSDALKMNGAKSVHVWCCARRS